MGTFASTDQPWMGITPVAVELAAGRSMDVVIGLGVGVGPAGGALGTGVPTASVTVLLINAFCAIYSWVLNAAGMVVGTTICTA